MKTLLCLVGSLLLSSSLTSHAQSSELPTTPHFYGGLGVYSSSHQNLGSWNGKAHIPVQAVVGYQLRPRLAVQLGVAYSTSSNDYAYTLFSGNYYPPPPSALIDFAGSEKAWSATATLLARYTLTRKPAHRFQTDLLGGAKLQYTRNHTIATQTTHDQVAPVITNYDYASTYTQPALSLGFGLRYRLVSQLEAVYDFTFDQPVGRSSYYYDSRLQATMALGLRYHFNPS